MAQVIAFGLIAVGVLLYHGILQRADGRRARVTDSRSLAAVRITVVDGGDGSLGRALLDELQRELPGARLQPIGLTPEAAGAMGAGAEPVDTAGLLAESEIIVGPWTMAIPGAAGGGGRRHRRQPGPQAVDPGRAGRLGVGRGGGYEPQETGRTGRGRHKTDGRRRKGKAGLASEHRGDNCRRHPGPVVLVPCPAESRGLLRLF